MSDAFNKKMIETWLNREFFKYIEADGYVQDAKGRIVRKTDRNRTDFALMIECCADRRFGEYAIEARVEIRWKKFEDLYYEFKLFDFIPSPYYKKVERRSVFLSKEFNYIRFEAEKISRPIRYVASPADLPDALAEIVGDYNRRIRGWLDAWLDWETALQLLDRDKNLCGSWRETAYFCLAEHIRGREAACAEVGRREHQELSQYSAAQVAYLRRTQCSQG